MEREAFLRRLKARGTGAFLHSEPAPEPWRRPPEADPAAAFTKAATTVGAEVVVAASVQDLARKLWERDLPRAIVTEPLSEPFAPIAAALSAQPFPAERDAWFEAATGLVHARAGAAATGSLLVVRTPGRILAASLVPPVLVALLRASDLHPDIETMIMLPELREHSAAIITGPSRSADIENDLTVGVHGPGTVIIGLLKDA